MKCFEIIALLSLSAFSHCVFSLKGATATQPIIKARIFHNRSSTVLVALSLIVCLASSRSSGLVLTNHFDDYPPNLQCGQLWTNQGVVLHFAPTVVPDDGPVSYCNFGAITGGPAFFPCRLALDFSHLKNRVTRIEIDTYIETGPLWLSASVGGFRIGAVTNSSSENQFLTLSFNVAYPDSAVLYANQAYVYGLRIFVDDFPPPPQAPWNLRFQTTNMVYWARAAMSADGSRAFALGNASPNAASTFYSSTNSGHDWTGRAIPFAIWTGLAASSKGERLVATASTGQIFVSTNSGNDWIGCSNVPAFYWASVAASADGSHLLAGSVAIEPYIYDPSQSWPPLPVVIRANGSLFTSTDFGVTWRSNNLPVTPAWSAVTSSADGSRLVAAGGLQGLYRSADAGQSWTQLRTPLEYVLGIASSADGTRLFASGLDGVGNNLWTMSADAGTNWSTRLGPPGGYSWPYLASSADGLKIVAMDPFSYPIYTSADAGQHWTRHDPPLTRWSALASSADGAQLIGLGLYGSIYTWQYQPALKANVQSDGQLVISWASTSLADGFELEHNTLSGSANWVPVNGLIRDDGTNRYLPFGVSAGPHCFRLRK